MSAAVIGGVGGAGLVGGAILAARNPRVKAAGAELGRVLLQGFTQDAKPLVEPLVQAANTVERRWALLRPSFQHIFADSAGFIDPLVTGALNGLQSILRGIEKTVSRAQPVMDALGESFSIVGDSIGGALTVISGDSEDAADALVDLAHGASAVIIGTAGMIRILTELYGVLSYVPRKAFEFGESIYNVADNLLEAALGARVATNAVDGIVDRALRAPLAFDAAATSADTMAAGFRAAKAAADGLIQSNRALYASTGDVEAAFDNASAAVRENGRTTDENTAKGRANRSALLQTASAIQANYDNFVRLNGVGPKSAAMADQLRERFIKLATQMTGSKAKAEQLANSLLGIPSKKETQVTVQTAAAQAAVRGIKGAIAGISGKSVVVSVTTRGVSAAINAGRILAGLYASDQSWGRAPSDGPISRTGGPTPVSVSSSISVNLDGSPFHAMTVNAVVARSERDAWRQKVGRI